ncbi:AAA family ATPase [Bacterioplanoides sp.]|uniref:AAA family ATPase n=1 Tax=Bacterioplanoides sp. TaxID=2066072 RepID=UPI003B5AFA8D
MEIKHLSHFAPPSVQIQTNFYNQLLPNLAEVDYLPFNSQDFSMFLKYGGRNFYCFKEDFDIDLRLNKNCPNEISHGRDVSSALCIKGANAAGKTNALKALSFLLDFITNSFALKPESTIPAESFFHNKNDVFLYCEFRTVQGDLRYEVTFNGSTVIRESLSNISQKAAPILLFERAQNEILTIHESFEELNDVPNIRSNASIISIANQYEIGCIEEIYTTFYIRAISNVGKMGFRDFSDADVHEFYNVFPDAVEFSTKLLKRFDTGIHSFEIKSQINEAGTEVYYPEFKHATESGVEILRLNQQSSGTKRLYILLAYCYLALKNKDSYSYFIADELDLHLHSKVLEEIITLFDMSENTQLIFTCQNDLIMDQMGKYRTVFINKTESESYSYRLDELPSDLLRNGRPITPHYHASKIGGVPNIGE